MLTKRRMIMKQQAIDFIKTGKEQFLETFIGGKLFLSGYNPKEGTAQTTAYRDNGIKSVAEWVCTSAIWLDHPPVIIGWEIVSKKTMKR